MRTAIRSLGRTPGFTFAAVATLAIGVGSLTALFSLVNSVYFRPLPFVEPRQLVAVGEEEHGKRFNWFSRVSDTVATAVLESATQFARISAYGASAAVLTEGQGVRQVRVLEIDSSFTAVFRLQAAFGRVITGAEVATGTPVAMISHALWQAQYGSDTVLGKKAFLFGKYFTIVGILPPGFRYPALSDVFVPIRAGSGRHEWVGLVGRVRPSANLKTIQVELDVLAARLAAEYPKRYGRLRIALRPEALSRAGDGGGQLPKPLYPLALGVILLIVVCLNLANLFVVRVRRRASQFAVRSALGASPAQLARQVLVEASVIAILASILGALFAGSAVAVLASVVPPLAVPGWIAITLDWRALGVVAGLAVVATIATGLAPARVTFGLNPLIALGRDVHHRRSKGGLQLDGALLLQVAAGTTFLSSAMLFARSYAKLASVDVGYAADSVAQLPLAMPGSTSDGAAKLRLQRALGSVQQLNATGLTSVRGHFAWSAPQGTNSEVPMMVRLEAGFQPVRPSPFPRYYVVSEDYFQVLRLPIIRGRAFSRDDVTGATPVAVVSRRLAEQAWSVNAGLGRLVSPGSSGQWFTVIGIAENVRDLHASSLGLKPVERADIYLSWRQVPLVQAEILATSDHSIDVLLQEMTAAVRMQDPDAVLQPAATLASQFDEARTVSSVLGGVLLSFAFVTLILAAIGVHVLAASNVASRSREIGIRVCLGSSRAGIVRLVLHSTIATSVVGGVLGLVLSFGVARLAATLLVDTSSVHPPLLGGALLFLALTLLGSAAPTWRALAVQPAVVVREE